LLQCGITFATSIELSSGSEIIVLNQTFAIDFALPGMPLLNCELAKNDAAQNDQFSQQRMRFRSFIGDQQNELLLKLDQFLSQLHLSALSAESSTITIAGISPLMIYGPSCTAKTLLALSFAEKLQRLFTKFGEVDSAVRLTCSDFYRQFGQAQHTKSIDDFRSVLCRPKIVIFDNLQELAGHSKAVHELEFLLEKMADNQQVAIFTSRQAPWKINKLGKRLISRLCEGTMVPVNQPGKLARQEIVQKLNSSCEKKLNPKQLRSLFEHHSGTFVDIQKRFNQLQLDQLPSDSDRKMELIEQVISAAAREFSLNPTEIKGSSRQRTVSTARNICIYLIRHHLGMSFQQIGSFFSGRDHSTIIHACKKCDSLIQSDEAVMNSVQRIKEQIFTQH
jgi:chromosomal replication initiator protein